MFFLHARFPLRLDCESWEGAPSLDLVGFATPRGDDLGELAGLVKFISAEAEPKLFPGMSDWWIM